MCSLFIILIDHKIFDGYMSAPTNFGSKIKERGFYVKHVNTIYSKAALRSLMPSLVS